MSPASASKTTWAFGVAIGAAAVLAYANSFSTPFVFDDIAAVTQNPSLAHFSTALTPPAGLSVTGRPLVNLSLALNHALSGEAVGSYHALNFVLHLTCALVLFGLIRRTLAMQDATASSARDATAVAGPAALLWAVHPVQTAAVTYVMQRSELLVSVCLLVTLYCFATRRWIGSVIACALGMAAKEVMAVAPLLVLLYDRTFVAGSFTGALRSRTRYYVALAATWAILAALVFGTENRGDSAGFGSGVAWTDYAIAQLAGLAHSLRITAWPVRLVFDFGPMLAPSFLDITVGVAALATMVGATLFWFRRRPALGFCGVAFLLLLAPTSLVPIATQAIAEHRIYLAIVVPLLLAALALRHRPLVVGFIAAALTVLTFARNHDYRSPTTLWADSAQKYPANARAHFNLAISLLASGKVDDNSRAEAELREALRRDPQHALAAQKLGSLLAATGRTSEAVGYLETALRLQPASATAHYEMGMALIRLRRTPEAARELAESLRLDPGHAAAHYNLGGALAELGRYPEALAEFEEAARLDPGDASARNNATRLREYLRK